MTEANKTSAAIDEIARKIAARHKCGPAEPHGIPDDLRAARGFMIGTAIGLTVWAALITWAVLA